MENVLHYLSRNRDRFIEDLCNYVRFPSVSARSAHNIDLTNCAAWLANYCTKIGLNSRIFQTAGHPIVVATTRKSRGPRLKHFVVYGHYDVQPAEPLDLWTSAPFEPHINGNSIFGRGVSDNKGQHLAHLQAVEAYLSTETKLPCDLTFVIEGEEEVGSRNLAAFLKKHRSELRSDAVVISDTAMPSPRHPALIYGLRGLVTMDIKLHGPSRDLHSGMFGGTVMNPATALCQLLGKIHDGDGRIIVPKFYDNVLPMSARERKHFARLPFNQNEYCHFLGTRQLFGEHGYTPLEQRSGRPAFEINGLTSGYQGEGSKTIVPAVASAKLSIRLVPNQSPTRILKLVEGYIRKVCPSSIGLEVKGSSAAEPFFVSPDNAYAKASLRALKKAFSTEPVLMRDGVSIPIISKFKRILGAETLLLGLGLPDDNLHAPNEKFSLDNFEKGRLMSAYLWPELSTCSQT